MTNYVTLYDSTLRDGAQTTGVDFSVLDKTDIALQLDELGIDYIEGGWPGANPTDDGFFNALPVTNHSKISAFGMTRRPGKSAENDPGLNAVLNSDAPSICLVGKSWDFHIDKALKISHKENLALIGDSIAYANTRGKEVMFDAEHFFDGYKANPECALSCIKAAYDNGARWIVLCDTNGGTLPHEIGEIIDAITTDVPGTHLGIHCHNDTEQAVANSLTAVMAGARQIQGTMNGLGERCGNANLVSIIPTLMLKMGYETGVSHENLQHLTRVSRYVNDKLNRAQNVYAPYVGSSAFAHKGGLHASAVAKHPSFYEHVEPETIGNERTIIVSNQAGRSNVLSRLDELHIAYDPEDSRIPKLVNAIKKKETEGFSYDSANASFALLAHQFLGSVPDYYTMERFRVIDERRYNAKGLVITLSEATVTIRVGEENVVMQVAEGNGPVNALDKAMRQALSPLYTALQTMELVDYKVRIINSGGGTDALTRVLIESRDTKTNVRWTTIGVSTNIIDASFNALHDSITYRLFMENTSACASNT